mgnify:CR=1 FL=1
MFDVGDRIIGLELPDTFYKLAELLEQDQFELLLSKNRIKDMHRKQDISLVYLMNDAVESFLVFHNATITGQYKSEYEGGLLAVLDKKEEEYVLVVHQGDSVITLFFEDLLQQNNLYNYGDLGHFWVKGYEYLRLLEYRLAILRDKCDYLDIDCSTPEERKLAALVEFPPLNYCCYPAVPEKYIVPRQNPWQPSDEAIDLMIEIAKEAERVITIEDGKIIGAEALCRWVRNGSIVPPMQFIPVLERSSSICVLDFYMLEHVCCDIRRWLDEGRKVVRVSVNLSRMHLGNEMLLENILGIIDRHDVPHEYLEIELTETSADVDFDELKNIVNGLHESNVSTAVDDFGTGFSSLKLITELPWGVLKIDKSFIPEDSNEHSKREKILRHIITMSHDLGMECIAEGVETLDQARLLHQMECYLAQGFYYAKPMPCEDYEKNLMCE